MGSGRLATAVALAAVLALTAVAVLALTTGGGEDATADRRTVQATGAAEREVPPDLAVLRLGVTARAASAEDATRSASAALEDVIEAVRGAGAEELQTRPVRVSRMSPDPGPGPGSGPAGTREPPYVARQSIEVRLRDLERAGAVIEAAVAAGATDVNGPRFTLADPSAARRAAVAAAVRDARATATAMAAAADVALGDPVAVRQEGGAGDPRPLRSEDASPAAAPPTEPGPVTVAATVTVTFAIE